MSFQNTPEEVETGTYQDATVDETETEEIWIHLDVTNDEGETEEKAFGFIIIPGENVSWAKKNTVVQETAQKTAGPNFDALEYYKAMFDYQVQETSFLPDHVTVRSWLDEEANAQLVDEIEEYIPDPVDMGEDGIADAVLDVLETYAESNEGSWDSSVEHFRSWLSNKSGVAEGEQGK